MSRESRCVEAALWASRGRLVKRRPSSATMRRDTHSGMKPGASAVLTLMEHVA